MASQTKAACHLCSVESNISLLGQASGHSYLEMGLQNSGEMESGGGGKRGRDNVPGSSSCGCHCRYHPPNVRERPRGKNARKRKVSGIKGKIHVRVGDVNLALPLSLPRTRHLGASSSPIKREDILVACASRQAENNQRFSRGPFSNDKAPKAAVVNKHNDDIVSCFSPGLRRFDLSADGLMKFNNRPKGKAGNQIRWHI